MMHGQQNIKFSQVVLLDRCSMQEDYPEIGDRKL
jgi:hypothetical protein